MSDTTLQQRAPRFLRWLHDDQAGYIEIVAGAAFVNKPEKIDLLMDTRKWFYLDPERPDLYAAAADYAAQLAGLYGNVYTGIRMYRSKKRAEANVKPGRVIFIDDAPAAPEIPYSASIRTSEASRHAYYKCAEPVTKDDARRAAAAMGGDPSGVDLTQLVRFPGTSNTKNGGLWPVEPESTPNTIYQIEALRSAWPAVECSPKGEITPLAMPVVEKHLANIDELLNCSRSQLIKPDTQTGRILGGEMLTFAAKGKMDDSRSMNACAVGLGLLLRGYPDDEIAAIVFHLYRKWGMERDKGTEWVKGDIARILAYVHTQHPEAKQSPTRYRQQAAGITIVSRPAASRARADRPTKFDPAMLFARYQAEPTLCAERRKARASALGISTATLDRLEDGLEAIGLIEIEAKPGMPGKVILLGGVINIGAPEVLSGQIEAHTPEAPIAQAESAQNVDRSPQCIGETHPPPEAPLPGGAGPWPAMWHAADVDQPVMVLGVLGVGPDGGIYVSIEGSCTGIPLAEIEFLKPAAPPATWCSRAELAEWTKEAFDAYPGRASIRKVLKHIEMLADGRRFNLATLKRLYAEELARRRYSKQDARELQKARTMGGDALRKKSRAIAGAAAQMHRKGDKRAPIWDRRAGIYALVEAERQQAEAERIQRIGYSLTEQAEMLDLVDQVRPERQKTGRAATRGRVPPNPAPAGAPAGSPYYVATLALAERLKQVQP